VCISWCTNHLTDIVLVIVSRRMITDGSILHKQRGLEIAENMSYLELDSECVSDETATLVS